MASPSAVRATLDHGAGVDTAQRHQDRQYRLEGKDLRIIERATVAFANFLDFVEVRLVVHSGTAVLGDLRVGLATSVLVSGTDLRASTLVQLLSYIQQKYMSVMARWSLGKDVRAAAAKVTAVAARANRVV